MRSSTLRTVIALTVLAIMGCRAEDAAPPKENSETTFHFHPQPLPKDAVTADWPFFLGPTHDGVCSETKLLKVFNKNAPTLLWETKRGTGYASPAVVGERLIHFHRVRDQEIVNCLHAQNGKRFWQFKYGTKYRDRYGYNNGPRSSPIIAGDRVITYGAEGMLHCLSLQDGAVLWSKNMAAEYKFEQDFFGVSGTPLLDGERLIINVGAPNGPTVVALNLKDGSQAWASHGEGARADPKWGASYASPVPAEFHGKRC
ncbi:MAG TPA: PQQ-binding-like beta-propeller repeat protein, partial [Planctomycetota bacterium]|nr:PQQ-binding-like beta-propeller repeat protein [Planctomycetota bacterium]